MKTLILARTRADATAHARDLGLQPHSRDVLLAPTPDRVRSLTLTAQDLIVELPGFRDRPDAYQVMQWLKAASASSATKPRWVKE